MTDLISRAEAISAICEDGTKLEQQGRYIMSMSSRKQRDADILSALPTVDAVPVAHGRWIIKDNPGTGWYRVTCSYCGEDVTSTIPMIGFFPNCKALWDYCPYCGAKMDGKDGESEWLN